jgi:hypothetical protein
MDSDLATLEKSVMHWMDHARGYGTDALDGVIYCGDQAKVAALMTIASELTKIRKLLSEKQ